MKVRMVCISTNFYPRSPCGERRESQPPCERPTTYFYPRSPCGERQCTPWNSPTLCYFYPRSPCGERRNAHPGTRQPYVISIHALLAESDPTQTKQTEEHTIFLSTLSLRRATHYDNYNLHCVEISIHALLAESDDWPPVRETIQWISIHALLAESDSARSLFSIQILISIHALLAESD